MDKPFLSSFSNQMLDNALSIDSKVDHIVESASGKSVKFKVGRVLGSLFDSGVDFYSSLNIIQRIEPKLFTGMETKDISTAIIQELEILSGDLVREFRVRYDEGIIVCLDDSTKDLLKMSVAKKIVKDKLAYLGYEWCNQTLLGNVASNLINRCRRLGIPEVSGKLIDQLFEEELQERLDGCNLYEYHDEMPSLVCTSSEFILSILNEQVSQSDKENELFLENLVVLCKSLLFFFRIVPSLEYAECLTQLITIFDQAKEPNNPMRKHIENFITSGNRTSYTIRALEGKKSPERFFIDQVISLLRKLLYWNNQNSMQEIGGSIMAFNDINVVHYIAEFAEFLWPEEWLAASSLQHLRHEILGLLYRYRCLSLLKLTKLLQVHPKHTIRALHPLIRDGFAVTHRLQGGELVLITPSGEKYCEHNLGLKLRCSLSSV